MKTQTLVLATSITAIALVSAFLAAMVLIHPSAQTDSPSTTNVISAPWSQAGGNFTSPFGNRNGNFSGPFQGGAPPFFNGGGGRHQRGGFPFFQGPPANLTVGQTIVLTSTSGQFRTINDSGSNGTASGSLTFTVTGMLSQGYTLSLTSGSITVGGTQYTISSGTAQTGPAAITLQGQGTTSSSGNFLIQAQARGSLAGSSASAFIDLKAGSTEYLVALQTTVQG